MKTAICDKAKDIKSILHLHATGGKRIKSSTAILQATCVDATLIPYVKQQFIMSMGCYGCRDATNIHTGETLLGFPFKDIYLIAENLAFLNRKETEKIELEDPSKN